MAEGITIDKDIPMEEIVRRVWLDGSGMGPALTIKEAKAALTRLMDKREIEGQIKATQNIINLWKDADSIPSELIEMLKELEQQLERIG